MRLAASTGSFDRNVFALLLYLSGFTGVIFDFIGPGQKTISYLTFDALIMLLVLRTVSSLSYRLLVVVLFFVVCFVINMTFSKASLFASVNGLREIIMLPALAIFFHAIFNSDNEENKWKYIRLMKKYATLFLILQIPFAAYQFLMYGASDFVGGTLGAGSSGIMALSILCLVFFMFLVKTRPGTGVFLFAALIPLFLNETKISFLLIPLLILLIFFSPNIKNIFGALIGSVGALIIFNALFTSSYETHDNNLSDIFSADYLSNYLLGDTDLSDDIPRFTKIVLSYHLISQQPNTLFFGLEYGLFRGGTMVGLTESAESYQWLVFGTRPYLFYLIMQGGLLLVAAFLTFILTINHFFRRNNTKLKAFLFVLFLLILFYNDAFRFHNFSIVYLFLVFYANSNMYGHKIPVT
jgi:hypothetical protein